MQKRFLHIAIRKYDFVEKRARARAKPEKRASGQKSARAEIRKARERKLEKRATLKRKTLTFQPLQDKIIEQIIL
ncbi:MAG: hypothetical protein V8R50_00185 [Clostridia bacterium]